MLSPFVELVRLLFDSKGESVMERILKKVVLLFCLSSICVTGGCSTKKENNNSIINRNVSPISVIELVDVEMQSYSAESIPLPEGITNLQIVQQRDSVVYLYGFSMNEDYEYEQNHTIYSINLEGELLWAYDIENEEKPGFINSIRDFYPDEDGLWVMLVSNEDDASKDYPYYETTLLHIVEGLEEPKIDETVTIRSLISDPLEIIVDSTRECFYLFSLEGLSVFDIKGNELFCLPCNSYYYHPCFTSGGKLAVCETLDSCTIIKTLDFENQIWDAEYEVKDNYGKMYCGSGYELYYTDNEHKMLYGMNLTTGEAVPILRWLDFGVGIFMTEVFSIEGECFLAVEERGITLIKNNSFNEESAELSQPTNEKILTLATFEYEDSAMMALQFNKSQSEYTIVVKDYSEYNVGDDNTGGLNQLNLDIASGDIPDLYDLRSIPISQYVKLGLLEDLYPYIDTDPEIERENYVQSLLGALETNGKLYCLIPHVGVMTIAANPGAVQKSESLTLDELIESGNGSDPFGGMLTRYEFIQYLLAGNNSPFVDWGAGVCNFNSNEFIQVLEFVRSLPETHDGTGINGEDPQLFVGTGSDASSLIFASASVGCLNEGQDCAVFVGMPGEEGMSYLITPAMFSWGMSAHSNNKDGAWKFIRQFLVEEYQITNSMPLLKSAWASMRQDYDSWIEKGGSFYAISLSGKELDVNITSDIYFNKAEELALKANGVYEENAALMEIICSEAQAFFAGDKTSEDVADVIQSRASIYMAEQS